jgi:hypothetical protein
MPHFVTLTYPDEFPIGNYRQWKRDLFALLDRLERKHPQAAAFWRIEKKRRLTGINAGKIAPHFHLLVWGLPDAWTDKKSHQLAMKFCLSTKLGIENGRRLFKTEVFFDGRLLESETTLPLPAASDVVQVYESQRMNRRRTHTVLRRETWIVDGVCHVDDFMKGEPVLAPVGLKEWFSLAWWGAVGSSDPRHLRAGTSVERVRSTQGVMFYASKYVCKVEDEDETEVRVGRWWGVHNCAKLPWANVRELPLTPEQALRIRRVCRRYLDAMMRGRGRRFTMGRNRSITIFCDSDSWWKVLPQLTGS